MRKTWRSIEEVPYCFSRSSIIFQGHTGWKINNLNPIWVRLLGRSQLSNPSDLPFSPSILDCFVLYSAWSSLCCIQSMCHSFIPLLWWDLMTGGLRLLLWPVSNVISWATVRGIVWRKTIIRETPFVLIAVKSHCITHASTSQVWSSLISTWYSHWFGAIKCLLWEQSQIF